MKSQVFWVAWRIVLANVRDLRFAAFVALASIISLLSGTLAGLNFDERVRRYEEREMEARNSRSLERVIVNRPPFFFPSLGGSTEAAYSDEFQISQQGIEPPLSDVTDGSQFGVAGVDWAQTVVILHGLMALMIGFSLVSGERERGQLRLFLSQGIARGQWLVGSWLACVFLASGPLVLSFVFSIASSAVVSRRVISHIPDELTSLALAVVAGVFFLSAMSAIALLASVGAARSATSLVLCIGFWSFSTLLAPVIAVPLSTVANPRMSQRQLSALRTEADQEFSTATKVSTEMMADVVRATNMSNEQKRSILAERERAMREGHLAAIEALNSTRSQVRQELDRTVDEEARLARQLIGLFPAGAFLRIVGALTVSGHEGFEHFLEAAREYEKVYRVFVGPERRRRVLEASVLDVPFSITTNEGERFEMHGMRGLDFSGVGGTAGGFPDFNSFGPSLGERLNHALPGIAVLVLWAGAALVAAQAIMNRYDVR